jgi:NAD(P)H-dependent FMN reductase
MLKIGIIVGTTRPGRKSEAVARWVYELARKRKDAEYELVDIAAFDLPLLDEPVPPSLDQYSKPHTKRWAEKIANLDAFVFVTGEYNHSIPGALKNAIDFLFAEWNDKAAGFVGYGSVGAVRSIEHLRGSMGEIKIADVRASVHLSLHDDFERYTTFKPRPHHEPAVNAMLDDLFRWARPLQALRAADREAARAAASPEAAPPH